jgi:ketosteroid isomerase-like protein
MTSRRTIFLFGLVSLLSSAPRVALATIPPRLQNTEAPSCTDSDSAAVLRTAGRFHEILSTGDTTGISAVLASDLRVLEGGSVENRGEYLSHHLSEDIAFARAVPAKRTSFSHTCEGDVAWLVSTSAATGKFNGRDINSVGAELLLLTRIPKGWQIRAIHWSSARPQPR